MSYKVLLYYKFTPLENPVAFQQEHKKFCESHHLLGRILIACEGINGTVAGTIEDIEAYKQYVQSLRGFEDIQWKEDTASEMPFSKLKVRLKPYLVNLGPANTKVDLKMGGTHLSPQEWRKTLESNDPNVVLLDVRNDYEGAIGRFKNAIIPPYSAFSKFHEWVKDLEAHKNKKILMYCTGGIRCEKFSALMRQEGFQDVNQLQGGILNYFKEEGPAHYEGQCFIFDDRLSVRLTNDAPLAQCVHCHNPEDRHLNCSNIDCNELFVSCDACAHKFLGACSATCKDSPRRRIFRPESFRIPYRSKGFTLPKYL